MLKNITLNTNIFKDWVSCTTKKHKKHKKKKNIQTKEDEYSLFNSHLVDQDYKVQYKSKKKKRQHRDRDEELANSLAKFKFESTSNSTLYNIQKSSKVIKKGNQSKVKRCRKNACKRNEAQTNYLPLERAESEELECRLGIQLKSRKKSKKIKKLETREMKKISKQIGRVILQE